MSRRHGKSRGNRKAVGGHFTSRERPPRRRLKTGRERAKELGICRDCREQATPNQTRCEACAEKHRVRRRQGNATRREKGTTGHTGGGTR